MEDNKTPKATFYELNKYSRFAEVQNNKFAKLIISSVSGFPRMTVFTSTDTDNGGRGHIQAGFDPVTFCTFIDDFVEIIRKGEADVHYIPCRTRKRNTDGSYGEITLVSNVVYGQDKEGINFIEVRSSEEGRPVIRFPFKMSRFHDILLRDNTAMPEKEKSKKEALSWLINLRQLIVNHTGTWVNTTDGKDNKSFKSSSVAIEDTLVL